MGMYGYGYLPGPCANCGKPHGGYMGSTAWGHEGMCCSDACGIRLSKKIEAERLLENDYDDAKVALRTRIRVLERRLGLQGANGQGNGPRE